MFKWLKSTPTPVAESHELADFVELVTWRDGRTSAEAIKKHLGRIDEIDYAMGVPEDEDLDPVVEAIFEELECRVEACAGGYPFDIDGRRRMIRFIANVDFGRRRMFYAYMLLATRLNMNTARKHAGVDGAAVFEELAAEAVRCYLGERSESFVFGTAARGRGFAAKVSDLCARTGEGDGFNDRVSAGRRKKDGKLDVVAWTPFSDGKSSKLLVFGQCKTGTHYKDQLAQLQPDSFCSKWFESQPSVTPVRAFFLTEALSRSLWRDTAVDAGLLFDRCRIVDCIDDDVSAGLAAKVEAWTAEAAANAELSRISAVNGRD